MVAAAALRATLEAHTCRDAHELAAVRTALGLIDHRRDPFDPRLDPTHITASGIVVDARRRVLLHRHKRLGRWLQPGGHVEASETVVDAVVREIVEETGLRPRHPDAGALLVHVDDHPGPLGHRHLDVRYLLIADSSAPFAPASGESSTLRWADRSDASIVAERSLSTAVDAALARVGGVTDG